MLSNKLQQDIDKQWEAFWPINTIKPVVIIDLITCILLLKRLDEWQTVKEKKAAASGLPVENPIYTKDQDNIRWPAIKDKDRDVLHELFTKENGVMSFMKSYGRGQNIYSHFMKVPLLVTPTRKLLENAVAIVKLFDTVDTTTQGDLYDYLIDKAFTNSENGQLITPLHIVKMMVGMMEPVPDDIVCDPAAASGRFLATCAAYVKEKYAAVFLNGNYDRHFSGDRFTGMEPDPVMSRIGAMNLLLHGVTNPKLKEVTAVSKANAGFAEQATLMLANPPFAGTIDKVEVEESLLKAGDRWKPGLFYVAFILKGLQQGGRAAIILPESILCDNSTGHQQILQEIIDKHKLEAVISMPGGIFRPHTDVSTAILIFTKTAIGSTDRVWFYNMQADGFSMDDQRIAFPAKGNENGMQFPDDYGDIPDILKRWKNREEETAGTRTEKSFFVPVNDIRQNGYNLTISQYQEVVKEQKQYTKPPTFTVPEKPLPQTRVSVTVEPAVIRKKPAVPFVPNKPAGSTKVSARVMLLLLLLVGLISAASYFFFHKNKGQDTAIIATTKSVTPTGTAQENKSPEGDVNKDRLLHTDKPVTAAPEKAGRQPVTIPVSPDAKPADTRIVASGTSSQKTSDDNLPVNRPYKEKATVLKPDAAKNFNAVQYKVISKAYFHNSPSEDTRRNAFIVHWNNIPVTPLDEKNDFIYVVFTNHWGQTSKGWLRKKDLKQVKIQ